jgi:hypothetical protein
MRLCRGVVMAGKILRGDANGNNKKDSKLKISGNG